MVQSSAPQSPMPPSLRCRRLSVATARASSMRRRAGERRVAEDGSGPQQRHQRLGGAGHLLGAPVGIDPEPRRARPRIIASGEVPRLSSKRRALGIDVGRQPQLGRGGVVEHAGHGVGPRVVRGLERQRQRHGVGVRDRWSRRTGTGRCRPARAWKSKRTSRPRPARAWRSGVFGPLSSASRAGGRDLEPPRRRRRGCSPRRRPRTGRPRGGSAAARAAPPAAG